MIYSSAISQILILFIIIFAGYVLRKRGIINKEVNNGLTNLLIEFVLPALIISSFTVNFSPEVFNNIKLFALVTGIYYITMILIAMIVDRILPLAADKKTILKFLLVFANIVFIGLPVLDSIYPGQGVYYVIVNVIYYNLFLWTYGVYIFIKEDTVTGNKNVFQPGKIFNNGLIAIVIGFIILFSGISLPEPVAGALEMISEVTVPLSLIVIGSFLTEIELKNIFSDGLLIIFSLVRLCIIPLAVYFALYPLDLPGIVKNAAVLLAAMPAPVNSVIFADKFKGNYHFASGGVFLTTLFSIITIPLFLWLVS